MDYLALGTVAAVGAIGWFLKSHKQSCDDKHKEHFAHATNLQLHETDREREIKKDQVANLSSQLTRHSDKDDDRFNRMDDKMTKLNETAEKIWNHVQGKN